MIRTVFAAALLLAATPALAEELTVGAALSRFCEPLVAGSSAAPLKQAARAEGFTEQTVAGQKMMVQGQMMVGISDAPRVCFIQAPLAMTMQQGFALVDNWGKARTGATRQPATKGPDGSPVRAWVHPGKSALVASHQTTASGQKVMNFILMPLPKR